jgi:hypothetical protein
MIGQRIDAHAATCLLQVCARNNSDSLVAAHLYIDGQKVAQGAIDAHSERTFSGVAQPSNPKELRELLFSLPRFVTLAEKKRAGTTTDSHLIVCRSSRSMQVQSLQVLYRHRLNSLLLASLYDALLRAVPQEEMLLHKSGPLRWALSGQL